MSRQRAGRLENLKEQRKVQPGALTEQHFADRALHLEKRARANNIARQLVRLQHSDRAR